MHIKRTAAYIYVSARNYIVFDGLRAGAEAGADAGVGAAARLTHRLSQWVQRLGAEAGAEAAWICLRVAQVALWRDGVECEPVQNL